MTCSACGAPLEGDAPRCAQCGHVHDRVAVDMAPPEHTPPPGLPRYPSPESPSVGAYSERRWNPGAVSDPGAPWSATDSAPISSYGAPFARWWQRVGAMLLDSLILGVPFGVLNAVLNASFGRRHRILLGGTAHTVRSLHGGAHLAVLALGLVAAGVYFAVLNGTGEGQTLGNRAPVIAVRDAQTGAVIGWQRGLLRWGVRLLLYVAFVLPGLLNDCYPLWDARRQTLADKAARSVVVRLR